MKSGQLFGFLLLLFFLAIFIIVILAMLDGLGIVHLKTGDSHLISCKGDYGPSPSGQLSFQPGLNCSWGNCSDMGQFLSGVNPANMGTSVQVYAAGQNVSSWGYELAGRANSTLFHVWSCVNPAENVQLHLINLKGRVSDTYEVQGRGEKAK